MSTLIDPDELNAMALALFRERLGLDENGKRKGDDDEKRLAAVVAAEMEARTKLWLGIFDRFERLTDKVFDRLDKRAVQEAARKALPEKRAAEPDHAAELAALLDELKQRPAVPRAVELLREFGADADNIGPFVTMVRESAPEWAAFLDDDPAWVTAVVDGVSGKAPVDAAE